MGQKTIFHKRRQFYIKKNYQFKFILKFCLLVFGGALISMVLLFFLSRGTLTFSFVNSRLIVRDTAMAILPATFLTNIVTLIVITLSTIVVVLFISHKIAGPMFRFEKDFEEIAAGNLTKKVRLRRTDQLNDLTDSINNMTSSLHAKVLNVRDGLGQIIASAEKEHISEQFINDLDRLQQSITDNFRL
ncbi:MAG: methyl-accepting chemotaxis protein [Pseudomonadota bacterium]